MKQCTSARRVGWTVVLLAGLLLIPAGCGGLFPSEPDEPEPQPPINGGAVYVGTATCLGCHENFIESHTIQGHSQALKVIQGSSPEYPDEGLFAGVPEPPDGFEWTDIRYVIGGYIKAANFIDTDGFMLMDGATHDPIQYNLEDFLTGTEAGYAPFDPDQVLTDPYEYECFRCHTTGPSPFSANGGRRQENRPGVDGTWSEAGVQCEACHGPGSQHVPDPASGNVTIDPSALACARCHANPDDPEAIAAADGFIIGNQQAAEVWASPHWDFDCTVCHDPHASVIYDREAAVRNNCVDCHWYQNMAFHEGRVFVQGDYVEFLSCESCHMPPASTIAVTSLIEMGSGDVARIGDTRTHLMFVNTAEQNFEAMFTPDGSEVVLDEQGQAAVTVDFVCQRCHSGAGSAFPLTLGAASAVADGMHDRP